MHNLFPEFRKVDFKSLWQTAIIIFDTNALLNPYRLPAKNSKKLLGILEKLKQQIWIPHQVALEFYKRRHEVRQEQNLSFEKLIADMQKMSDGYTEHSFFAEDTFADMKKLITRLQREMKKKKTPVSDDKIGDRLCELFSEKVGEPYPTEKLKELCEDAKDNRYPKKIPPGYMDKHKGKGDGAELTQYGDCIIWHQILDKAKEKKLPIIFVTEDGKEDWWWREKGATIGARYELKRELWDFAEVEFHMYTLSKFMKMAVSTRVATIDSETIDLISGLQEKDKNESEQLAESRDDRTGSSSGSSLSLAEESVTTAESPNLNDSSTLTLSEPPNNLGQSTQTSN